MPARIIDAVRESKRTAILVSSHPGQPSAAELARLAAIGDRPRKDYVELARELDADVIDDAFMAEHASPLARAIARQLGLPAGQITEIFLRRRRYQSIVAWADRLGLPLALAFKLARARRETVLISVWLSHPKKALLLEHLRLHTHLGAIVNYGSVQMEYAATELGVPRQKLHLALSPVDDRFWFPREVMTENMICAVGSEQRDYATLVNAVRGLELEVELAVGTVVLSSSKEASGSIVTQTAEIAAKGRAKNVRLVTLTPRELRHLYSRSRFVVVPLFDVDYDAGVTATVEAMAMGKAVIVSRTRGQVDIVRDGENGIYVPPGHPAALRSAIEYLDSYPAEAERMGRAGRALVEERHTLDSYIARLSTLVRETRDLAMATPKTRVTAGSADSRN